jgi:uncharacterized protein YacL
MEFIITLLLILIALETSYLTWRLSKRPAGRKNKKFILVDTSVLIDGRIVEVARSGFITDVLAIPRSVIGELQFLADNSDSEKRTRARHGLDVVTELQALPTTEVKIIQDGSRATEGVDERLLKLAKQYGNAICTIDYNLNKVAQVEKIKILNVNDLAMSLRMAYLPGEHATLELIDKGNDGHQAVGHLPDGTMVVVEKAKNKIGQRVEVEFTRSLQTAAGKMMFAKLVEQPRILESKNLPQKSLGSTKNYSQTKPNRVSKNNARRSANKMNESKKKHSPSSNHESDLIKLVNNQK